MKKRCKGKVRFESEDWPLVVGLVFTALFAVAVCFIPALHFVFRVI